MRQLTSTQKKLLTKVLVANEPEKKFKSMVGATNPIHSVDDLDLEVWHTLVAINDTD